MNREAGEKPKKFAKTTPLEKRWILYDVGNSAFTLLVSTLIPIFFDLIAGDSGASATVFLGYATSIATAVVALLGPLLGAASDLGGMRKKIFAVALLIGAVGCGVLGFIGHWIWFLVLFVLAKSAYSLSLVIYDSMLCDVTTRERMDEISSRGYALGYIGSCIPFILCVGVYILYDPSIGIAFLPLGVAMPAVFLLTAAWWVLCSMPLLFRYRQTHYVDAKSHPVRAGMRSLGNVFRNIGKDKHILFFLIAFFFYIDGVYTIIDLAVAYGTDLGLNSAMLLLALLVTQIVAFPAALLLGMLSRKVKPEWLILVCIAAYFGITVYAIFLSEVYEFWILAVCVGLFQGTIQAMSRSYFAKIVPQEKSGEYFGVYDIFGKGASFLGTFLVALVADLTGRENLGVGALAVMFALGFVFFLLTARIGRRRASADAPAEGANPLSVADPASLGEADPVTVRGEVEQGAAAGAPAPADAMNPLSVADPASLGEADPVTVRGGAGESSADADVGEKSSQKL